MSVYSKFKDIENEILNNPNVNSFGVGHYLTEGLPLLDNKIRSFKYTHCDLNKEELAELYRMLNINEKDGLVGGDVYSVIKRGDGYVYNVVRRIDIVDVLILINGIINRGEFRKDEQQTTT
jgi:hypothetical protein